jgi:hypothetical protein
MQQVVGANPNWPNALMTFDNALNDDSTPFQFL